MTALDIAKLKRDFPILERKVNGKRLVYLDSASSAQKPLAVLDAMDDATFRAMNDVDFSVERVLEGIEAARAVGLPVKVNCVVKRGVNDNQIVPMARYFRETGDTLRFSAALDGARGYLALSGGIDVPHVLGSASTSPVSSALLMKPRAGLSASLRR